MVLRGKEGGLVTTAPSVQRQRFKPSHTDSGNHRIYAEGAKLYATARSGGEEDFLGVFIAR